MQTARWQARQRGEASLRVVVCCFLICRRPNMQAGILRGNPVSETLNLVLLTVQTLEKYDQ